MCNKNPRSALTRAYIDAAKALVEIAKLRNQQLEAEGEETINLMNQVETDLEDTCYEIRMQAEQILIDEQNS